MNLNTLLVISLLFSQSSFASSINKEIWQHVVTVDRLTWQEREGQKKINKRVNDESFVRRIYLDITGRVPTYDQMLTFRQNKSIDKREKLINELLNSPGYVSNFTTFWQDLLRNKGTYGVNQDPNNIFHREYTRYMERFLFENKPYNKIVYDLLTATGKVQENPAIGYHLRDIQTGVMDTVNATARAFLGTRIGCAQCHNHRFDKWTQKDFYETTAYFQGIHAFQNISNGTRTMNRTQVNYLKEDERSKGKFSFYSNRLLDPSMGEVTYDNRKKLHYPKDYSYDNAKPNSHVKERIVFDYGPNQDKTTKSKIEAFATWVTSKENPMFSKIMANRLWKRIMGYALMNPIDDWKDNITVQNPQLFHALGEVFVELDYDIKALLKVIFNSETYQYAIDRDNEFHQENYHLQGAMMKRMSSNQINDSLLLLRHGDLAPYARISHDYFAFEDNLDELVLEYSQKLYPLLKEHMKTYNQFENSPSEPIQALQLAYLDKVKELEDYHNIGKNGFIKTSQMRTPLTTKSNKTPNKTMMMQSQGSDSHQDNKTWIQLANYAPNSFMKVFGMHDRSAPDTHVETSATLQQILKIMNSPECKNVTRRDSYLMKNLKTKEKFNQKISYLYYSIFGRAPDQQELKLALHFFSKADSEKRWQTYVLALLNSPEFYFIK